MTMKKGIAFLPVILVVLILALGTGFGLLATKQWNPSWNPFGPSTSSGVLEESIAKLLESKSFKLEGTIGADIQEKTAGTSTQNVKTSLFLSELIDNSDKDNPKTSSKLNLTLGSEGFEVKLRGEVITSKSDIYLKVNNLPAFLPLGIGLEGIENQWFKIEGQQFQTEGKVDEEKLLEDLKGLLTGKDLLEIKDDLGDSHYLVGFRKEAVKELIPEFFQLIKKYLSEEEKAQYEQDLETFLADFSQNFERIWEVIGALEFEFWLDPGTSLPQRVKFEKEFSFDTGSLDLTADMSFSNFNEKFEIEIPKDYKPIEEIIPPELFAPLIEGGTEGK